MVVADRTEAMTAKKTPSPSAGQLAPLALLAPLDAPADDAKSAKGAKSSTRPPLGTVAPLPDADPLELAVELGWSFRHLANAFGISGRATEILAGDGNLVDVIHDRVDREPEVLRRHIARMAAHAGGWDAMVRFGAWKSYGEPARHEERRLPWD